MAFPDGSISNKQHLELHKEWLRSPMDVFEKLFNRLNISIKPILITALFKTNYDDYENRHDDSTYIKSFRIITSMSSKVYNYEVNILIDEANEIKFLEEVFLGKVNDEKFITNKDLELSFINQTYTVQPTSKDELSFGTFGPSDNLLTLIAIDKKKLKEELNDLTFFEEIYNLISIHGVKDTNNFVEKLIMDAGKNLLQNKLLTNFLSKHDSTYIFETIHNISLLRYEGSENSGNILFCLNDIELEQKIFLQQKFSIGDSDVRVIRKLSEISNDNLYLLCDGVNIFGIGKKKNGCLMPDNSFSIKFRGQGTWDVIRFHGEEEIVLMSVNYGIPSLPKSSVTQNEFANKFETAFNSKDYQNVWSFVEYAKKQNHGTMVVVTEEVNTEVDRLSNQCFSLEKTPISCPTVIQGITSIDGAILLDPKGVCHAIGVILDGISEKEIGKISRGARYNSALRYINKHLKEYKNNKCLVIIISEDGMVDVKTTKNLFEN